MTPDAAAYERILTDLARAQGVRQGPPGFVERLLGRAPASPAFEDPWSTPVARTDDLLNPASPLLRSYAYGACPGADGGEVIDLPPSFTFGLPMDYELESSEAARERLQAIPSFARGMVVKAVEAYARRAGAARITPELLADVRARWGSRFRPRA